MNCDGTTCIINSIINNTTNDCLLMNHQLEFRDGLIFVIYFIVVASYGYWVYRRKKKATTDTKDFFLAEGSLTWWAIGASLIASNISAEQFIGMSGDGFFAGIAVAAYEWIAALALIIIAVWFMPIYLKNKIYTMPQFLTTRYNGTVALFVCVRKPHFHTLPRRFGHQRFARRRIFTRGDDCTGFVCRDHYTGWYESDRLYRCDTGSRFDHWRIGNNLYGFDIGK
jgi:Sodium:solute symporter family